MNGKPLKLKGTCNHQNSSEIEVAGPSSIRDYRICQLKDMGSIAYRCPPNPPAKECLDACDRSETLVVGENRYFNVSDECMRQLTSMIRRDRNHLSLILWSVFSEEPMRGAAAGCKKGRPRASVVQGTGERTLTPLSNLGNSSEGRESGLVVVRRQKKAVA